MNSRVEDILFKLTCRIILITFKRMENGWQTYRLRIMIKQIISAKIMRIFRLFDLLRLSQHYLRYSLLEFEWDVIFIIH